MSGPWEKYQQTSSGPWDKYKDSGSIGAAPSNLNYLEEPKAIQQMPPEVSVADRAVIKNFGADPNAMVQYLQERYPDYNITHHDKNIFFEKPGEHTRVLDPNLPLSEELTTGHGLKELGKDLLDVPVDLAQGAASKTAGAAAGLAGGAATLESGGWGALPAAMAASGATNASSEALKQKLGQYLGIPQEVNKGDVALSGVAGALDPLVFGTGAGASAAEKYALPQNEIKTLIASQRGVPAQLASKVGSLISGIPSKTIESAAEHLPEIKKLETEQYPASEFAKKVVGDVGKVESYRNNIGKQIGELNKSSGSIPLKDAQAPYLNRISELEKADANSGLPPSLKQDLENLKSEYMDLFGATPEASPAFTSPDVAFLLQKKLGDAGQIQRPNNNSKNFSEKVLQGTAKQAAGALADTREQNLDGLSKLNTDYESVSRLLDSIGGNATATNEKAYNFVRSLGKPNKQVTTEDLSRADQDLGTNFIGTSNLVDAFNRFSKDRKIPLAIREKATRVPLAALGGVGGYYAGSEVGGREGGLAGAAAGTLAGGFGGSPRMMRYYLEGLNNNLSPAGPIARDAAGNMALPLWDIINARREQNQ